MGIFQTAFRSEPQPEGAVRPVGGLFDFFGLGGSLTSATTKSALTLSAFYNGIDQLSNDIAKLPKYILKKDGENRNKYTDHPANILIAQKPSGLMNSFELWKIITASQILKGNAYVEIIRNQSTGRISSLVFRSSDNVQVFEDEAKNVLYYSYKGRFISGEDMLHFKGFTLDGKVGIGVVTFAAYQLGVYLNSQTYASEVYQNKGISYGVLETEKAVKADIKKTISDGFNARLAAKNVFRAAVLDEGFKYKQIAITPAEAQFLETNKAGITEVARWLNIAPHKLKDLTNANYSNIYQQSIEHVQDSILPWVIRDEQELNNKLFAENELGIVYTKFNIASLLRGDLDMLQKFYTSMVYSGIYTRNEIRALEDKNPIEGLDEPLQPVNMQALSQLNENMKNLNNDKDSTK